MRFTGFTDEWKRIKVSDLLDFYSTNSLSWEMLNYEDGDFHNLHYGLIHSGLPTLIDLKRDTLPFVNDTAKPKNYTLCKEGDIAFADASEDTNDVAKAIEFINLEGQQVISGLHTIHGRDNGNKTVVGFKGYAFASSSFHNQIRRIAQGTKIYSISSKSFDEVFISIPNKAEQTKIARLLHLIDERIATQNKIIEDLKKLKSAIGKSLLSCTDLLERKISIYEIGSLNNGYAFQSSSYDPAGEYEILTIANVTGNRYICNSGCSRILTKPSDLQSHQDLKKNDILISMTGNVGRVSLCKDGKYLLNQRVGLLKVNPDINAEFVYQALSSHDFEKTMISCSQGAAQMNIGKGDIENYMLPYSDNPNNLHKIAELLYSYDIQIDIEEKTIQLLNQQKVYLLKSMFI